MSDAHTKPTDATSNQPNRLVPCAALEDELRPKYDASMLKNGVRGNSPAQYCSGTNLVLLAPDVAKAFPTEQAVNEGLRRLMQSQKTS